MRLPTSRPFALAVTLALLALGCMVLTGCSKTERPPLGTVEGLVTLDGAPLSNAAVLFTPEGPGRTSIGFTDPDGRYRLFYIRDIEGADVGNHAVRITTVSPGEKRKEQLPKRYHAATELSAVVQPGGNQYDFALFSK